MALCRCVRPARPCMHSQSSGTASDAMAWVTRRKFSTKSPPWGLLLQPMRGSRPSSVTVYRPRAFAVVAACRLHHSITQQASAHTRHMPPALWLLSVQCCRARRQLPLVWCAGCAPPDKERCWFSVCMVADVQAARMSTASLPQPEPPPLKLQHWRQRCYWRAPGA
jgi:hypothetical protein